MLIINESCKSQPKHLSAWEIFKIIQAILQKGMLAQEHKLYTISKLRGESTNPDFVSRPSINLFL